MKEENFIKGEENFILGVCMATKNKYKRNETGEFSKKTKIYNYLLKTPEIKEWIRVYKKPTANQYLNHLHRFLKEMNIKAKDLIQMEEKKLKKTIVDYALIKERDERAGDLQVFFYGIRAFLKTIEKEIIFNHAEREKFQPTNHVRNKQHWLTDEEVYKLAETTKNLRDRAIILTLAETGIRVNALSRLTVGMVIDYIGETPIPLEINNEIDTKISKRGLGRYYTFLAHASTEAIKDYLEQREREGEKLKDDAPLFLSRKGTGIKIRQVQRVMKEACERIGLENVSVHSLRKWFSNKVDNCKEMNEKDQEFLKGHKIRGSRENYYNHTNTKELGEKYMGIEWGKEPKGRLSIIEKEKEELKKQVEEQQKELREVREMVKDLASKLSS